MAQICPSRREKWPMCTENRYTLSDHLVHGLDPEEHLQCECRNQDTKDTERKKKFCDKVNLGSDLGE